ncbi:integral membrane protein [Nannizzia gypsea CBS 118893]|uniref:Integral membrane protein n=1 Tax=Arthroderma gypseum (strain ATCC MYA-4604 / CBS 118893) TaxID=535722 RepID=E4V385_ARTGP|nr:integral membrane protein [Nannizzia gypsea CBS 118893]EFR04459.1 integral membrane protein [Nannizzia gypsea CBS 118893]
MGKGGRFACIFLPYILSIGTLVCLALVGLGCYNTSTLTDVYFAKVDMKDINTSPSGLNKQLQPLAHGLEQAKAKGDLHDFYIVGMWNYCYGDHKDGADKVTHCSPRQSKFWFNPAEVWGVDDTIEKLYPSTLQKGLNTYKKVAGWIFVAYAVAISASAIQLLVGISAIFSRWGSFFTTIVAGVSAVFTLGGAATASVLYGILVGAIETGLKPFNIKASVGTRMLSIYWLGALFTIAGGFFWLLSVCCCSGRSPYGHRDNRRGVTAEKAPYTYERVASPYGAHPGSAVPMHNMPPHHTQDTAYEPFRHDHRV